jgi:aminoglycoside phosphotransferase (APT) family kinase protein
VLPEPVTALVETLRPACRAAGIDVASPPIGVVLRGRSRGRTLNVVLLDGPRGRARVVVKSALREQADDLLAEHDALRRLSALHPALPGVPDALGHAEVSDRVVTAQTFVDGVPLAHRLRDRVVGRAGAVVRAVRPALAWLAAFQDRTRTAEIEVDVAPLAALATAPAAARLSSAARTRLERYVDTAARHRTARVPSTWAHGDYWPGNVVLGATTGVVDWGHLRTGASPLLDLCSLLHTTAHFAPWPGEPWTSPERAVDRAFAGRGAYARLARSTIARRLRDWGVAADLTPVLVLLALLEEPSVPGRAAVGPAVARADLALRFLEADDAVWAD